MTGGVLMQAIFETLFDVVYLLTVIILGIKMLSKSKLNSQFFIFGLMAIILGLGDAFHLVPRAIALNTTGLSTYTRALGIGKVITSITMTIFYILLYYVWRSRYKIREKKSLTLMVYILSILRIMLSIMPQNKWLSTKQPLSWGIYRNIPFLLLGLLIIKLFYDKANKDNNFKNIWLTIVFSFAFYIPVVLLSSTIPAIGVLMIPKTCAYIWTVLIGYNTMKKEAFK